MKRSLILSFALVIGGAYALYAIPSDRHNTNRAIEDGWKQLRKGAQTAAEKIQTVDFQNALQPLAAPQTAAQKKAAQNNTSQQLARYEKLLCDLANAERKKRGLSTLTVTPALATIGRAHSREMQQKKYFAHESPTPSLRTPMDRYRTSYGETPRLVAENIYMLEGPKSYRLTERDFRRAHEGWMKSQGHRENILRSEPVGGPTQIGVGIVVKDGAYWATQMFAQPRE